MAFLIIFILIPPSSRIRPPDELQGPPLHYFEISIYGLCTDFERVAPRKIAFFRSKFFLKMPKTRFLAFFRKKCLPATSRKSQIRPCLKKSRENLQKIEKTPRVLDPPLKRVSRRLSIYISLCTKLSSFFKRGRGSSKKLWYSFYCFTHTTYSNSGQLKMYQKNFSFDSTIMKKLFARRAQ